jgi:golgin subfamily A member 4
MRDKKGSEIDTLFKANENFIRDLKFSYDDMLKEIDGNPHIDINEKLRLKEALKEKKKVFEKNGFYSDHEIAWYREMMKDIDGKYQNEMVEREKRLKDIEKNMVDKKNENIKLFDTNYTVTIEDLSAKDGTGKKYGKPKRVAQVF